MIVKDERGQSVVEMALILPILLLLLIGIFDVGRAIYSYMHLQAATQESVRLGGLGKSDVEITDFARNYIHIGDSTLLTVTITPDDTVRKSGDYVVVTLQYPVQFATPMAESIFSSSIMMTANSTIRVE